MAAIAAVVAALLAGLVSSTLLYISEKAALASARTARANEERERLKSEGSERIAKTEAAKSAQTAVFITDMLSRIDPEHAQGKDTTLIKEMLAEAAQRVG